MMKIIRVLLLAICCCGICQQLQAKKLKVLFIGNSYTEVNNLPEVIQQIAANLNDTLVYQMSSPGGYTFEAHSTYAPTLNLIAQGGWDVVVLQEQSQYPSFPIDQVTDGVFPYARKLDSLVHVASPCAQTVFYMTWGRKDGDVDNCPQWPPVCTYQGMDSLLQLRYTMMADSNKAWISPVAKVWHYVRTDNPAIELYQADGSHPSIAGSYLAALSFYSVLFGKDPSLTTYTFGVNANDAGIIRQAAKLIAYDSLAQWRSYHPALEPSFSYTAGGNTLNFTNNSEGNILGYSWDFGDGSSPANTANPTHTYAASGNYQVCLTISDVCHTESYCKPVNISSTVGVNNVNGEGARSVYPNPANDFIRIDNIASSCQYALYDAFGHELRTGWLDKKNATLNISDLERGIYYIQISTNKNRQVVKWVKK